MKKRNLLLLSSLLVLASCELPISSDLQSSLLDEVSSYIENETSSQSETSSSSSIETSSSESSSSVAESSSTESSSVVESSSTDSSSTSDSTSSSGEIEECLFTSAEQKIMTETAGIIVPYVEADDYEVEKHEEYSYIGYVYTSYGLSSREYKKYLNVLEEKYGSPTKYENDYYEVKCFHIDDVVIEAYYDNSYFETETSIAVLKKIPVTTSYTEFNDDDKTVLGDIDLPFYPCTYYDCYIYEYDDVLFSSYGIICYNIYEMKESDLTSYLALVKDVFGDYSYDKDYDCYVFTTEDYEIDVYMGSYITDSVTHNYIAVEIYEIEDPFDPFGPDDPDNPDVDPITNKGKGLPTSESGVYDVDFTKATYKEVTGAYAPSTGNTKVLVIPVEYPDIKASDKGYTISDIEKAFTHQEDNTGDISLYDYYYTSSYGKLNLDIEVLDTWFTTSKNSGYYYNLKDEDGYYIGEDAIMDEIVKYLDEQGYNLKDYDTDGDGAIDAICMISTFDVETNAADEENIFGWAYSSYNYYGDEDGNYYEYDEVIAGTYFWSPYQFLHETEDGYDGTDITTYTVIHEFAHVIGAYDYYDTSVSGQNGPLDSYDLMDYTLMDHNPYTKFIYNWITSSRLVVTDSSVTLDLTSFENTSDTIIIGNNFDEALGAYQEYYVICYYTNDKLNEDSPLDSGIVVYHVDSSLYEYTYDGDEETYYYIYNDNGSRSTENNLIEFVKNGNNIVYKSGDKLDGTTVTDNNGDKLSYSFVIDSITSEKATITFTKNK